MSVDVEKIVRDNIEATPHMSLATVSGKGPWVCEVHFAFDNDLNLYFRSKISTRHAQEITDDPRVAGNIVRQQGLDEYPLGLYFEGTAELLTDDENFHKYYEYFKQRQSVDETIIEDARQEKGHRFHKITVKNWYTFGKFDDEGGKKHELAWNGGKS